MQQVITVSLEHSFWNLDHSYKAFDIKKIIKASEQHGGKSTCTWSSGGQVGRIGRINWLVKYKETKELVQVSWKGDSNNINRTYVPAYATKLIDGDELIPEFKWKHVDLLGPGHECLCQGKIEITGKEAFPPTQTSGQHQQTRRGDQARAS